MNTQIEEKSRRKAAPVKTKNQDLAVFPGKKYFIILADFLFFGLFCKFISKKRLTTPLQCGKII